MSATLVVNEIYLSLQGESTFAGLPCVFVRLTACNLRCSYCDTAYAFTQGSKMAVEEVRAKIDELSRPYGMTKDEVREAPDKLSTLNPHLSTQYLPRCLDMISAEEVIRRVELYFAGGAVDFLTAEQAVACAGALS